MNKRCLYRVSIMVRPCVWRFIDNRFPCIDGAYDLTGSMYYYLITSMLCRSNVKAPSLVCSSYSSFVSLTILVSEFDFYHYGYEVSELQQCRFSKLMYNLIIDDACKKIAQAKVAFGVPVTTAIEHYLVDNNYEDNELDSESLRTIYKRKYKSYENELKEYFNNAVTDYGFDDEKVFDMKKNVVIVPNHFK